MSKSIQDIMGIVMMIVIVAFSIPGLLFVWKALTDEFKKSKKKGEDNE